MSKGIENALLAIAQAIQERGVWKDWTPTFQYLAGGTLDYARYCRIGDTIFYKWRYTLAGAGVTGGVTFTPPTAMKYTSNADPQTSQVKFVGTSTYPGFVRAESANMLALFVQNAAGTYLVLGAMSATVPFTFAAGHVISCSGSYELSE